MVIISALISLRNFHLPVPSYLFRYWPLSFFFFSFGCSGSPPWRADSSPRRVGFSLVAVRGLSCPAACGILLPPPGIKPSSPALEGGFLTTGPPGKSPGLCPLGQKLSSDIWESLIVCSFWREGRRLILFWDVCKVYKNNMTWCLGFALKSEKGKRGMKIWQNLHKCWIWVMDKILLYYSIYFLSYLKTFT